MVAPPTPILGLGKEADAGETFLDFALGYRSHSRYLAWSDLIQE